MKKNLLLIGTNHRYCRLRIRTYVEELSAASRFVYEKAAK
ncbi:MAG: hypothetical protein K0Q73_864 [Paenibacillus sp.]|jgi:hypothetical protein|nr:hypothetical protein [Paenibacillus sp.]